MRHLARWLVAITLLMGYIYTPAPSWAVNSFVQTCADTEFTADTNVACTWGSNTTSGNVIACAVWWGDNTSTITSVSDSVHGALTDSGLGVQRLNSVHSMQMFYAENITGGTTPTITATFSGSLGVTTTIGCHEVSGRATSGALDQKQWNTQNFAGTGTDFITSGSVTTTTDGQYIFGVTRSQFSSSAAAGTNFTRRTGGTGQQVIVTENLTDDQVSAGSIAATFTPDDNDGYITGIMTFKSSGGGGPNTSQLRRRINH